MKYVLYIDYRATYKPMSLEYRPLVAKTLTDAILEADTMHDPEIMYLIRIMEKSGKAEKVESDVKAQTYVAKLEKRSTKWAKTENDHIISHFVKHYIAKFGSWFE